MNVVYLSPLKFIESWIFYEKDYRKKIETYARLTQKWIS